MEKSVVNGLSFNDASHDEPPMVDASLGRMLGKKLEVQEAFASAYARFEQAELTLH
jgi:hypothetical protein